MTVFNALVVGAGSVGRVFARHLRLGGARVWLLVRPGRARELQGDPVYYPLNSRGARRAPVHEAPFDVLTDTEALAERTWDQIYLCVPSDALRGTLLDDIAPHIGGATVVKLQPGLRDRAAYTGHFAESQIVTGMLALISYRAPLVGETVPEPGTAYWFPPLLTSPFSGEAGRVTGVFDALRAGGYPARSHPNVETFVSYVLAAEAPLTAGLECADWSTGEFTRGPWLSVARLAIHEAGRIAERHTRSRPPLFFRLINVAILRLGITLLPKQRPIPLEAYLQHHFTKVGVQTRQHLDDYIEVGSQLGLDVGSLRRLREGLGNG